VLHHVCGSGETLYAYTEDDLCDLPGLGPLEEADFGYGTDSTRSSVTPIPPMDSDQAESVLSDNVSAGAAHPWWYYIQEAAKQAVDRVISQPDRRAKPRRPVTMRKKARRKERRAVKRRAQARAFWA